MESYAFGDFKVGHNCETSINYNDSYEFSILKKEKLSKLNLVNF